MTACVAILIGLVVIPDTPSALDFAHRILDVAQEKAWAEPEPREAIDIVLRTAIEVDPGWARDRIRVASALLDKRALPPMRRNVQASLALLVAPHDRKLRDDALRRAIIDGRRALADEGLWLSPLKPAATKFGDPRVALEQEKLLLALQTRLYEAVLKDESDPVTAVRLATDLLVEAKAKGSLGGDAPTTYLYFLCRDLADLDPAMFLATVPRVWEKNETAKFCAQHAHLRWLERRRDQFTRALATYAINNGVTTRPAFETFGYYDLPRAWALAAKLPDDTNDTSFPRLGVLADLIVEWAWRDPEAALAAAEQESSVFARRELIDQVSRVWARKKPGQIERAIRLQDNAVRQRYARDEARAELERRKQGKPPRNTRESEPKMKMPMNSGERDAAGLPRGRPDEIRVLDNPKDTGWLMGPNRSGTLSQAAWISYFESRNIAGIGQIVIGLSDANEADTVLCSAAERVAEYGAPAHAAELLGRVKSSRRAIQASCEVARALAKDLQPKPQ
jgi:hypothetical protein